MPQKKCVSKKINKKVNKQNIRNSENWLLDDIIEIKVIQNPFQKLDIYSQKATNFSLNCTHLVLYPHVMIVWR